MYLAPSQIPTFHIVARRGSRPPCPPPHDPVSLRIMHSLPEPVFIQEHRLRRARIGAFSGNPPQEH